MKIVVYSIALNEAKHVARFCESARDADLILVADTGSTDGTVTALEDCGATVAHISIKPWRFDDARNAALALLPEDFDVCVSLDLDEVLQPGWREEIERVWAADTTRLRYGFDWGCGIAFQYEKIHARRGYRWFGACHEYPVPDRITEVWANTDRLLVVHKPDPAKSRGQYLDLLRVSVEENPTEPRNAFYYARELSFAGQWQAAADQCKRYLELPRATWSNERCYAMRVIGRCYQELKDWEAATHWLRRACSDAPCTREPWHDLSLCCYRMGRWPESFGAAMTCLSITNRENLYTVDPAVWGWAPHDLAAISAWNMGMLDVALDQAKLALAFDPDDMRLRRNVELMSKPKEQAA
jgi:glycosyltransferase involved in cell wall biosynthesis